MTHSLHTTSALLPRAYRECRSIAAANGRTYFLATRLLSADRRPAVHALYAFARMVDDVVDHPGRQDTDHPGRQDTDHPGRQDTDHPGRQDTDHPGRQDGASGSDTPTRGPVEAIDRIERELRAAVEPRDHRSSPGSAGVEQAPRTARTPVPSAMASEYAQAGADSVPQRALVLTAVADTIQRYDIDTRHFWTFLDSMRMDVPGAATFRNRYATMTELREYMRGSAAAIGLQLLPVLGTVVPVSEAEPAAAALGEAFQLTNFVRDIAEDLDRDRVYLPADTLTAFGVSDDLLFHCRRTGHTDQRVRRALAHLIAVNRDIYRRAEPGIDLLEPRVRPAIRTAAILYADILRYVERSDYAVFAHRAVVPRRRRLRIAATEFAAAALRSGRRH
ncbi:squalene/phytoene synthase family protein [Nocardia sp. 004]|uniref:phytoene/squalene synthase family protein n=1 Tax=Nocardia sp. 004 TaxID=3385978 RepID=UPI0039A35F5E